MYRWFFNPNTDEMRAWCFISVLAFVILIFINVTVWSFKKQKAPAMQQPTPVVQPCYCEPKPYKSVSDEYHPEC